MINSLPNTPSPPKTPAIVLVVACVCLGKGDSRAATPLLELQASTDITVQLTGARAADDDIATDDLNGNLDIVDFSAINGAADLDGYHLLGDGALLFSLDTAIVLPGDVVAAPGDVVRFDGTAYSIEFDGTAQGVASGVNVDAVSVASNGDLILSFDTTVIVDGITVNDEDLVRFDGIRFSPFFDGSASGIPATLDLDAVHRVSANGHLLLSFDGSGGVGGLIYADEDVLEFDPVNETWELAYDASARHFWWALADLDAVYASTAPSGSIPDGSTEGDTPLTLDKLGPETDSEISLSWSASCVATDVDYAIYEGALGDFSSHTPVSSCTTAGATTAEISPESGNRYYLVVPQGEANEGAYGVDGNGTPRPVSSAACQPQLHSVCL